MVAVCLYFQVHQPIYLRRDYSFFNIGQDHEYEDDALNKRILKEDVENCYLPANELMLQLIKEFGRDFSLAYSISGTILEQVQRHHRGLLDSFKRLADTGCVEFISETYYHSLASLFSRNEFYAQALQHRKMIQSLFGQVPSTFRNTELIYNNDLAKIVEEMGYSTILTEGADHVFGWRTPNFVYRPVTCRELKVLARNYRLSEDIALREFKDDSSGRRLSVEQFVAEAHAIAGRGELLNLFMNYTAFDRRREKKAGIFEFFRLLPRSLMKHEEFCFRMPAQVASLHKSVARLDVPHCISWSEPSRDTTAWIGNSLQDAAVEYVFKLEKKVLKTEDAKLIDQWRRLQASDHFCAMCTKAPRNCCSRRESNPYDSPHLAHIAYMNMLNDLHEQTKGHADPPQTRA